MVKKETGEEIDRVFDEGGDVLPYADADTFERPNKGCGQRRVSVDMPEKLIARLDAAAEVRGVNRQAVIKMWLCERLDEEDDKARMRRAV